MLSDANIILGVKNDLALSHILIAVKTVLLKQDDNNKCAVSQNRIRKIIENEKQIDKTIMYKNKKWIHE